MKKITLLLSILFIATFSLQAQKQFAGEIQFKTKIEGTNDPNLSSGLENLTTNVVILGNKAKGIMNIEGMLLVTNIWDGDKETQIFVIEYMGLGKFYKKITAEELKDKLKFLEHSYKYENDYKEICDFKCQKVIATVTNLEDDSTNETIMYVTKEIGSSKINNAEFPGLEGYPLMILSPLEEFGEGCNRIMEATKITPKKIKDVDFLLPADAKNIEEEPEIKEMFKGFFREE